MPIPAAVGADLKRMMAIWRWDPVRFVREVFAAGWEKAHPGKAFELERWQVKGLQALVGPKPRIAARAAKGVGKSALLALAGWWFLATRRRPKGFCCSITEKNLELNLWTELALWHSYSPLLQELFECNKEQIQAKDDAKFWWLSKRAFAKDADPAAQAESLAGLHGDAVFILLDEVGSYPKGVFDAAGAIFNVLGNDALLLVAGNATDESGPLGRIWTAEADRWALLEVTGDPDDPDRCSRIDIAEARAAIALYTREDPMVRVNILGLFPLKGSRKLLGADDVARAMRRAISERLVAKEAIIWGLDVAGEGLDPDNAVLTKRQGNAVREVKRWRNMEADALADAVALEVMEDRKKKKGPNKIFVDRGNTGRAVHERLRSLLGNLAEGIDFGGKALDDSLYLNRRAEMWWSMAEWVRNVGSIPESAELRRDLTAPNTETTKSGPARRKLESKDEMRKRGIPSPDDGDSLALTFAAPVLTEAMTQTAGRMTNMCETEFDPWKVLRGE